MNIKKIQRRVTTATFALLLSVMSSQSAFAAPGTLATAPLFLSTIVEPNVFFTLDDSGSMGWNLMVENNTAGFSTSSGLPIIGGNLRAWYNPDWFWQGNILPPSPGTGAIWTMRNHIGNKNYYNPDTEYTPWAGVQANGNPMFTDASPTAALRHPVNSTQTTNLTTWKNHNGVTNAIYLPTYHIWQDDSDAAGNPVAGGDGVIDAADSNTRVVIDSTIQTSYTSPGGIVRTYAEEIQNFANWFVYYRSRELAAKASIGRVINNTDATRMGLDVFNAGHQQNVQTMTDANRKRTLLNTFYGIVSSGGTPARNALDRVGQLFESSGANAPILSAANGGECQQNFNILMTDGFWNGGVPAGIGNADGDNDTIYDGDDGRSGVASFDSNDGGNYADGFSDTLADIAMHYYENDLRTLANKVPTTAGVDEADHQHLVTYTIAFGLNGTLDPTAVDPTDAGFNWPQPASNTNLTVDDLWHTAYNGRGQYLNAQNPDELETSLNDSIADIAQRTATAAAVSINSATLTQDTIVYLAQFNSNRWQGNLFAISLDVNTGKLAATPDWNAGTVLTNRNITTDPRVMLTHDGTDGVPFQWADISTTQKDDLRTSRTGTVDTDVVAEARLNYLRGSRVDEGSGNFFRERASLLGDIVNSGPVFVGTPSLNWPDTAPFPTAAGDRYTDYKNGPAKTRDGMVYVGANDGMLHGFLEGKAAVGGGSEKLAYIPGSLFSTNAVDGLHYLTEQSYKHKYYVDLTPSVSDIFINSSWKTVLIGALRGGGRGLFALDVTDPTDFTEAKASDVVMWEFTDADDPDLGFTYSRPQIGLANDGSWVAIFGNGYNSTGDGEAKLFILRIKEGLDGNWTGGYQKITTNSGTTGNPNGLATPALADLDGNGTIDRAYAGDLQGQMWAFDLSDPVSSNWNLAYGASPLFVTNGGQPITTQPALSRHPSVSTTNSNEPNVMVYSGSGQYLVNSDKTDTSLNRFYGVWDNGSSNVTNLVEQVITQNTFTDINGLTFPVRELTNNPINYTGGEFGWYINLPDSGERSIFGGIVRGKNIFFNTFAPVSDPCSVGGYGWEMAVDIASGGAPAKPPTDVDKDGKVDSSDLGTKPGGGTFVVSGTRKDGIIPGDAFVGNIKITGEDEKDVEDLPNLQTGRFSWQELIQ